MKRRDFLRSAALSGAALSAAAGLLGGGPAAWAQAEGKAAAQGGKPAKKPNFIVIMADDLGWGDLACYGHPALRTPRLDQLAAEGLSFTQFYCNAAICSPTRAAMMTGLFPGRVGMHAQISSRKVMEDLQSSFCLDPTYPMTPRLLQERGYHTIQIGKWHLSGWLHENPELPRPGQYGFDEYLEPFLNWPPCSKGETWRDETHRPYATELFVDQAIASLERRQEKAPTQPFFLQLWLTDPHEPITPAPEHMHAYDDIPPHAPYEKTPQLEPQRLYWSVVTEMDRQLGRLFDRVDALGLGPDTYIIFTSDNGAALSMSYDIFVGMGSNGPLRGQKGSLYEGGVRTPFIVRRPGTVPAGNVDSTTLLSGVDFMPTFCALAGQPLEASITCDGQNMAEALNGQPRVRTTDLMWEWRFAQAREVLHKSPMLALRRGDWKLLINPDGSRTELYNIPADPMEVDNVAAQNPQVVETLRQPLMAFHESLPKGTVDRHVGANDYPWPK